LNPFYIPLKRSFEESVPTISRGKGFVDLPFPIKRIKGSGREIIDPIKSMIQQVEQFISIADKARVARALVNLSERFEGTGKWVEKVPPPMEAKIIELDNIRKQIEAVGGDLSQADMESLITLFSQGKGYYGKDNIVAIYRNGKREYYQIHPMLFESLKGLDKVSLPIFLDYTFGASARMVRLGATGIRAGFTLITNPIRDAQTFALQSEHVGAKPHRLVKSVIEEVFGKSKYSKQFRRAGGEMAQPLGLDRRTLKNAVEEILADDVQSKALNTVKHPIEALRKILSFPEAGIRLAEYEGVMKKYEPRFEEAKSRGDLIELKKLKEDAHIEAINAANEVTVNFKRAGAYGAVLNQFIPFFNPAVQGISKMGRTIYEHPTRSLFRATTYLTAPTLALWWINKDEDWYKELPTWQKWAFWNFKIGDRIIRLPKPFEWGYIFSAIPEAIADAIYRDNPSIIKDAVKSAGINLLPPVIPALVKPAAEVYFNWDMFRERKIVPEWQENLDPREQYSSHTSSFSKKVGDILNVSPIAIDHLLSGYTGGLVSDILNGLPKEHKEAADIPVVGRIFTREGSYTWGGQSVQDFYDIYKKSQSLVRTVNNAIKNGRPTGKWDTNIYYIYSSQINSVALRLSELRDQRRLIENLDYGKEEKEAIYKAIDETAVVLSRELISLLKNIKENEFKIDDTLIVFGESARIGRADLLRQLLLLDPNVSDADFEWALEKSAKED